jgi:hypothetical protein
VSEEKAEKRKPTWREIVMAKTDSEIPDTGSGTEQLSSSETSSAVSWKDRMLRVLGVLIDRQKQYGDASEVYAKLGAVWSARLGVKIDARMVLLMLMDMKTVRSTHKVPSQDTLDDIVGYALLYGDAV